MIHPAARHLRAVTDAAEADSRSAVQEDEADIRLLKATYMACLNDKNWPGLRDTLADNASVAYEGGLSCYRGREAIMDYLRTSIGHLQAVHTVSNGRIQMRGQDAAVGQWDLRFHWHDPWDNTNLAGGGTYADEYVRTNQGWKISFTGFSLTQ